MFPFVTAPFRGGWLSANRQFLSQLPIRAIDFADTADCKRHDTLVELVQRMLDMHKEQAKFQGGSSAQENFQRQIDATDKQIDALVYELYGLSDAEVRIVEEEKEE